MDDDVENENFYLNHQESLLEQVVDRLGAENDDASDVHALLIQRETDLLLAAQLGKSLLEKNQFLQEQQEHMADEYSNRLEELHHEKLALQRNQQRLEAEYENVIIELQNEIAELKNEVSRRQLRIDKEDKSKIALVQELKDHNDYLSGRLQKASLSEATMQSQIQDFQQQIGLHRAMMHGHVQQLEALHGEILSLSSQRNELEQKVSELLKDRAAILECVQDSQNLMAQLQCEKNEREAKYAAQEQQLAELREQNALLLEQLSDSDHSGSTVVVRSPRPTTEVSLFDEMRALRFSHSVSMDSLEPFTSPPPYADNPFFTDNKPVIQRPHSLHIVPEFGVMCDEDVSEEFLSCLSQDSLVNQQQFQVLALLRSPLPNDKRYCQLKREVAEVYSGLRQMLVDCGISAAPPGGGDCLQPGSLFFLMQEVQSVMRNLLRRQRSEFLVSMSSLPALATSGTTDAESCQLN